MQFTLTGLWGHMGLFARLVVIAMGIMSVISLVVLAERLLFYFKSRNDSLAFAEKLDAVTSVSLSEPIRLAERQKQREEELRLENRRRVAKGEKPLASVEELEKDKQAAEDEATDTAQDANRADDEPDVLLTEAGNILLDAIQLNQRIAVSN